MLTLSNGEKTFRKKLLACKGRVKLTAPGSGRFTYVIKIAVLNSTRSRRIILINQNNYKSLRQGVEQRGQSEQHSWPFGIVKLFFRTLSRNSCSLLPSSLRLLNLPDVSSCCAITETWFLKSCRSWSIVEPDILFASYHAPSTLLREQSI